MGSYKLNAKQKRKRQAESIRYYPAFPGAVRWRSEVSANTADSPFETITDETWGRRNDAKVVYIENPDGSRGDFVFGFKCGALSSEDCRKYNLAQHRAYALP